jgi:predicted unusual protein kinase regulating ubiquinone biosynthesis (AarF/ABC1/UbiB family)
MRRGRAAATAAAAAAGTAAVATATAALRDADRRHRLERQLRVYRLTARRTAHLAAVKLRGARATEEERARLEERFAIRSAEDVAQVLGGMEGAIMKAGQMISFIAEGLPPEAQKALATLQADVPPMAPSLAAGVVRDELGGEPEDVFLDWDPVPVAAASIGQVHKAVLHDGRIVAVKVQYPGVDKAIKSDLDNAEFLYGLFASFALPNMDVKALVDELRARMADELDYTHEAACQTEFHDRYAGHPFVHVPAVVPECSSRRVLTSEWVDGLNWTDFLAVSDEAARQRAAEILFRFAQGSVQQHGVFNGDPHPGNYRFQHDGSVTFLDFGLVKRWTPGELESLQPILEAVLAGDPNGTVDALVFAGFLRADNGHDPQRIYDYVKTPYVPFQQERFTFDGDYVARTIQTMLGFDGAYADIIRSLNVPPAYVILDRVTMGLAGLLSRLHASNAWRGILDEYIAGGPPSTPLGREEAEWRASRALAVK